MRARYDAEDYLTRPLPPVEVEVQGGTELRSVLEILRKHGPKQLTNFGPFRVDQGRGRNQRDHFEDRGGSGGGRGGGGGRGSRDGRRSFDHSREKEFAPQPPRGPPPDFQTSGFNSGSAESAAPQRKISTYMDVDAPKVSKQGILSIVYCLYIHVYSCI